MEYLSSNVIPVSHYFNQNAFHMLYRMVLTNSTETVKLPALPHERDKIWLPSPVTGDRPVLVKLDDAQQLPILLRNTADIQLRVKHLVSRKESHF